MKRIFYLALCLVMATAVAFCFVACGDEESDEGTVPTQAPSQTQTTSSKDTTDTSNGTTDTSNDVTDTSEKTDESGENTTDSSKGTGESFDDTTDSGTDGSVGDTTDSDNQTTDSSNQGSGDPDNPDTPDDPEPPHEHTFADVYSFDGQNHFYASTCGHPDEVEGLEPHIYDGNGKCKCGHVIDLGFYNAIKAILANKRAIKSVNSKYTTNNLEFNSVGVYTVLCEYYNRFLYIKDEADYKNEYYYAHGRNGTIFGVCVQSGLDDQSDAKFIFRVDDATESHFNGAMYTLACIGDSETAVYGAEALVEALYLLGLDDANGDFVTAQENGTYTFSFMHCVKDDWMDYLYQISVSFTMDKSVGAMANLTVTVNRYGKDSYTLNESGKCVLNEDAAPNMKNEYEIQQSTVLQDLNKENPYAPERIAVDSLTIKDSKGTDIQKEVIRVRAGESLKLVFGDIKPDTALFKLCKVTFKLMNTVDGTEIDISPFPNDYDNSYTFTIDDPGAYMLVVNVDDVQFISTVEVDLKMPVSISSQVYNSEVGSFKQTRKATVYVGTPLYFKSYVPNNYDGSYKATLNAEYGEGVTITEGEINGTAVSVFKADAIGTYVINISSEVDPYLVTQLKVDVVEAPSLEDLLVGEYYANDNYGKEQVRIVFDENHNAIVTYPAFETDETIACSVVDGSIIFESIDGDEGLVTGLRFDESFNLLITIDDRDVDEILLTRVKVEEELVATGKLAIRYVNSNNNIVNYAYEYYSTNRFVIYKDYSLVNDVALFKENGVLSIRYDGSNETVALTRISGDNDSLAGEYTAESEVEILITEDETPTAVQEPQFGVLQVIDLDTHNAKFSAYYLYEIVNGKFVFYKDGDVTEEVSLVGEAGAFMFTYPGVAYATSPDKIVGEDDIFGGEYNVNVSVGTLMTFAKIVIVPGATMDDIHTATEPKHGTMYVKDSTETEVVYNYEIVDGSFLIYKDGRLTTDVKIIVNLDGTYSYQSGDCPEPLQLIKTDGNDKMLAGTYSVGDMFTITISSGLIPSEPLEGTIEIVDYHCNGNLSGKYTYSFVNGIIVVYDRDGNIFDGVKFNTNIDGTYSFQSLANNLLVPQSLVKVDGMSILFGGVYNINGENGVAYTFTFTPGDEIKDIVMEEGTLEITDGKDGSINGTYTYVLLDRGTVRVYKDGEIVNNISITLGANGIFSFQYDGMDAAEALVKIGGEKEMLSGVYTVNDGAGNTYELTFLAKGYEMPKANEQDVILGNNSITVPENYIGVILTYTAEKDTKIDFTFKSVESSDKIYIIKSNGDMSPISSTSYAGVELAKGEAISFLVVSGDANEHEIRVNIAASKIDMPDDEL